MFSRLRLRLEGLKSLDSDFLLRLFIPVPDNGTISSPKSSLSSKDMVKGLVRVSKVPSRAGKWWGWVPNPSMIGLIDSGK